MNPAPIGGVFVASQKKVIRSIKGGRTKKNAVFVKPFLLSCVKESEIRMKNWLTKKDYKG